MFLYFCQGANLFKVKIDKELCIGCCLCSSMNGDVFCMDADGKSSVREDVDISSNLTTIKECISSCPVGCIKLEEG